MPCPLKLGLLTQADREEWEQEAQVVLGVRRVLEGLGQAVEKLRQEGGRLHGQEKEMWRQQSKYQSKQSWHRTKKVVLHLSGEFQELVRETQGTLDGAISQLQYIRDLNRLQLLQIQAPKITLHIASSLPAIYAPDNAFHNSFFYQNDQNKLFILRECLASVGSFSLLLTHCLAHITAADLYQDSNPIFLKLFYEGLKACLSDAFSVKLQMSAIFQDRKSDQSIIAVLLKGEPTSEERDLLSHLFDTKVKFCKDPESPEESMKKNKRHLLFTHFEHFLKNKLSLEQQILTEENTTLGISKSSEAKSLPHFNPQEKKELDSLMQQLTKLLEKEDDF
uniref:Uncharacterized protein LOC110210734 n=1 Tax=Phascolarctos cinereus TaxID=38626 RepID=A0A6P5KIR1_PHACI|nr:uncharacterized protein LOC110210734 [Phascolarctos cinereus]